VRALGADPGAFTTLDGRVLKVHSARAAERSPGAPPGTVVRAGADGLVVATGAGSLRLLEVQAEGRRRLPVAAFLAGRTVAPGTCLGGA
jgi:methionyl-tRNA formyltransferase